MLTLHDAVDVFTIISIIVAGAVALNSYNTWRQQTRKTYDRDLARRTLMALYRLRDAIVDFRAPFITVEESASAVSQVKKENPDLDLTKVDQSRAVYVLRWRPIGEAARDLSVNLVEVEAAWGKPERERVAKIRESVRRLHVAMSMFFDNNARRLQGDRTFMADMYTGGLGEGDDFADKMNVAIEDAEGLLRDKMKL